MLVTADAKLAEEFTNSKANNLDDAVKEMRVALQGGELEHHVA